MLRLSLQPQLVDRAHGAILDEIRTAWLAPGPPRRWCVREGRLSRRHATRAAEAIIAELTASLRQAV